MSQTHSAKSTAHPAKSKEKWKPASGNTGGFIWFMGFIGAFIYYVEQTDNFGGGIVAFLKALAWPAFLVHKLLG